MIRFCLYKFNIMLCKLIVFFFTGGTAQGGPPPPPPPPPMLHSGHIPAIRIKTEVPLTV